MAKTMANKAVLATTWCDDNDVYQGLFRKLCLETNTVPMRVPGGHALMLVPDQCATLGKALVRHREMVKETANRVMADLRARKQKKAAEAQARVEKAVAEKKAQAAVLAETEKKAAAAAAAEKAEAEKRATYQRTVGSARPQPTEASRRWASGGATRKPYAAPVAVEQPQATLVASTVVTEVAARVHDELEAVALAGRRTVDRVEALEAKVDLCATRGQIVELRRHMEELLRGRDGTLEEIRTQLRDLVKALGGTATVATPGNGTVAA